MQNKLTTYLIPLLATAALTTPASASGINEQIVPEEVEWLLHIDADTLRASQSGGTLIREFQALSPLKDNPDIPVDPTLIINGLRGITAFGSIPDFQSGEVPNDAVVVIEGTQDLMQVLRGMIAGVQLEKPEMLATIQVGDQVLYQMAGEAISGTFLNDSQIAIGKSLGALESFLDVNSGNRGHLSINERFPSFKVGPESGFFLGAVVEGINGLQNLPAQARILQLTRAVSVQLGEVGENLKLEAGLKTADPQTATQVKQVLEGIIALTSITQTGQPEIAALVQSARVSLDDTTVALSLAYPVDATLGWIKQLAAMAGAAMEAEEATAPPAGEEESTEGESTESVESAESAEPESGAGDPGA
jgi:hypothetical protein